MSEPPSLRVLLPDLLGKLSGLTDKDGNMIFPAEFEIPEDCYIFFIKIDEWKTLKSNF